MRYREPFTVYPRRLPSGRIVYYFQSYDDFGRRTAPRSTGKSSKGAARQVCYDLLRTDSLVPLKGQEQRFEDFAKGWWDWETCEYLAYRRSRRKISRSYADAARGNLKNHILPFFGKKRLKEITSYSIERWMILMQEKGVKNASINVRMACLRTMLGFAVQKGMLKDNAAKKVEPLQNTSRIRGILNNDEVQKLFDVNRVVEIWQERIFYVMNLLSACTGMRMGEVIAVRGESLRDGFIVVDKQYTRMYGLGETKTYDCRRIPLPEILMNELEDLKNTKGDGFLFTRDDPGKPVSHEVAMKKLKSTLEEIGIGKAEQKERYITFHSWRHYFNTVLRSNNISDGKVQSLTGHKSKAMTEHYTHFNVEDFADVKAIQNKIVPFNKAG